MSEQREIPCTCGKAVVFCPATCENRVPDREDLITDLRMARYDNWDIGWLHKVINQAISYIEATPLHLITQTGQRLCNCEKVDEVPLYKRPDINQAKADDWVEGLEVPIANKKQLTYLTSLIDRCSTEKKRELLRHSPWLGKKNISSIISKLERT